jgi:hypothetical protein
MAKQKLSGLAVGLLAFVLLGLVIGVWACSWLPPFH